MVWRAADFALSWILAIGVGCKAAVPSRQSAAT